ncbi:hypothetical protein K4L06_18785 [Lysobacter sp. BMK333-48F3]|uniref:hypothetical protein n=1 Tax=Lysobacter sp. BMK333-48F3 TaxID=2867962 RepID=UPI001C8BD4E0|nr:hypothetical protein [Lysobacter sp. BMK333-48F3]MBX9403364.1 hypothetical protein [Lysobacter sp. BMK333-48F3]
MFDSAEVVRETFSAFFKLRFSTLSPCDAQFPEAFLTQSCVRAACADLGWIDLTKLEAVRLGHYEFQGSLVGLLVDRKRSAQSAATAWQAIGEALEVLFPHPFDQIFAYRLDGDWCEMARESLCCSYLVGEVARGLWWLLVVEHFD